ncbi:unnamed protein product [Sphenostylis stenocarpa]|uniref:Uncharacterized protein n=1 Tax=Sphenostylis stenocarpa TaxID=92480 RepID=A0AA86VNR4_9FABA|nr:unnamed protein product [Sphenostylis stenocarpa]
MRTSDLASGEVCNKSKRSTRDEKDEANYREALNNITSRSKRSEKMIAVTAKRRRMRWVGANVEDNPQLLRILVEQESIGAQKFKSEGHKCKKGIYKSKLSYIRLIETHTEDKELESVNETLVNPRWKATMDAEFKALVVNHT